METAVHVKLQVHGVAKKSTSSFSGSFSSVSRTFHQLTCILDEGVIAASVITAVLRVSVHHEKLA